ncbi:hypothetical protein DET49_103142 [Salegentibacter sp. 24]|uniref:hypothetical protein n=1 Tax=Salegentibacter sp. 24 TaxID=2183986 RepID=UPI0010621546|nr:hypothetical protein [Salegentibacter sp. 24]TDN95076.1 hypothetical protein DET49_103142 [Salegentibacter sp. 24]
MFALTRIVLFQTAISIFFATTFMRAQQIPSNYELLYEQDFEGDVNLNHFEITDSSAWQIGKGNQGEALVLYGKSRYQPPVRSPLNIAYIKNMKFGSFILEADVQQTGKEYGHRDLCLFFGLKDPSKFYYIHMATSADQNAHNIFLVNDAPRTNIASRTTEGVDWGTTERWHKIRLERNIETGCIRVFINDMTTPVMEAKDMHYDFGYIGFGSFDDTGKFDNIKIWGSSYEPHSERFFY